MSKAVKERLIDSRGFTLIEILIATLLFSVALLGVASLVTVVLKGNYLSKQITTATALAQQKMEENINKGYVNLTVGTETENYGAITASDGTNALFSGYKRVSIVEDGPVVNTRKLTVTVFRKRDDVQISFYTIIAK
jgi:prepilin-type N-terminal cleavage/methylation domain-containing protein